MSEFPPTCVLQCTRIRFNGHAIMSQSDLSNARIYPLFIATAAPQPFTSICQSIESRKHVSIDTVLRHRVLLWTFSRHLRIIARPCCERQHGTEWGGLSAQQSIIAGDSSTNREIESPVNPGRRAQPMEQHQCWLVVPHEHAQRLRVGPLRGPLAMPANSIGPEPAAYL